ncbi:WD repeat-containing protein mio-A [Trichinella spiralis]|uniref:WD repeat-containing protein mio-A n=1 Tax=Trichinella spiralis TaxID=6334 RepID=A0A0V1BUD2_TRISP|nr:WD repeat-containing protein mio-A [Trichinella spiralis]
MKTDENENSPAHQSESTIEDVNSQVYGHERVGMVPLSSKFSAALLNQTSGFDDFNCLAWSYGSVWSSLVAVGHKSGRLTLFAPIYTSGVYRPFAALGELMPCMNVPCESLAWNPRGYNFLAVGYQSRPRKYGLVVFDIQRSCIHAPQEQDIIDDLPGSVWKFAKEKFVQSIVWQPSGNELIVGVASKHIRTFDLRTGASGAIGCVPTSCTLNLEADPFSESRFLSRDYEKICIWDMRWMMTPTCTINTHRPVIQAAWNLVAHLFVCLFSLLLNSMLFSHVQFRQNSIACLFAGSSELNVYYEVNGDTGSNTEQFTRPLRTSEHCWPVVRFAFDRVKRNRLFLADCSSTVSQCNFADTTGVTWCSSGDVITVRDDSCIFMEGFDDGVGRKNCSATMRNRAKNAYTIPSDLAENKRFFQEPHSLSWLWPWLAKIETVAESLDSTNAPNSCRFPGVKMIFPTDDKKDSFIDLKKFPDFSELMTMKNSLSENREKIIALCGWGHLGSVPTDQDPLLNDLCKSLEIERAIYMLTCTSQFERALQLLEAYAESSSDEALVQALVLYPPAAMKRPSEANEAKEGTAYWHKMCSILLEKAQNLYVRALLHFLSNIYAKRHVLENILQLDLPPQDKVALSALYLSKQEFLKIVDEMVKKFVNDGNLNGLFLTGLIAEKSSSFDLIQRFLDVTGDVQTACLLLILINKGNASEVYGPGTVNIVKSYMNLLSRWRLWDIHCELKLYMSGLYCQLPCFSEAFYGCAFCVRSKHQALASQLEVSSSHCEHCSFNMFRCALCSVSFGINAHPRSKRKDRKDPTAFWFVWCCLCKHGGHKKHLNQWFKRNSKCPVPKCKCECTTLS